jgi:curved DNA-binding protein CbpA
MPEKLYEVLGVGKDASTSEIQQAYRRKVKENHPDVSDDHDAEETFQLVITAKEVLTDEEERDRYDDLGHEAYMDWFGSDGGDSTSAANGRRSPRPTGSSPRGSASSGQSGSGGTTAGDPVENAGATSGSRSSSGPSSTSGEDSTSTGTAGRSSGTAGSTSGTAGGGSRTAGTSGSSRSSSSSGSSSSSASESTGSADASGSTGGAGGSSRSTRASTGAVSQSTVAGEAERTRKEWQAAARRGEASDGPWSTPSSQGDHLEAERVETGIATKVRAQDAAEMTVVMLVAYPIFVFATIWPTFPMAVNAFIGLVTVAVVVYTMTEPVVSLVVFGTWSVLTPLLLVFLGIGLVSLPGLFALTVSWVPFLLSFLLTLAMPD